MDVRPTNFRDFIGQERAKQILGILTQSAKKQNKALPHCLMSGSPGLGKTTLCRILAQETGSRLVELVGRNLETPKQIQTQLASLNERDILFIDEIHGLASEVEEILYSAMEDRCITLIPDSNYSSVMKSIGVASQARAISVTLPPFTLVGATTLPGLLSAPLRSRFIQTLELHPYTIEELQQIVVGAANRIGFPVPPRIAREIAIRSRDTARTAISNLQWFHEFCMADGGIPTMANIRGAFSLKEIDDNGLTAVDRRYIQVLVEAGAPVGLSTMAAQLNQDQRTLELTVEPYLLRHGYISRHSRGRVAERKAFELLQEAK